MDLENISDGVNSTPQCLMVLWGGIIIYGKTNKVIINERNMRDRVIHMEKGGYYALTDTDHMSVFLICTRNEQGELNRNIVNFHLKEPVEFTGILDLGLKIDTLYARLHRLMAITELRFSDVHVKGAYEKRELDREHIPLEYCTEIQNVSRFMVIGITAHETLVVEIHQRQLSSIQGRIEGKYIEGNYISFRSALELVRVPREYEYM